MATGLYVNVTEINQNDFFISKRNHSVLGEVYLINPKPHKHFWNDGELHFRSLLIYSDGQIICSGFPKFKNYGEDPKKDLITKDLIKKNKVFFSEKMDGTLIIRTVINGWVSLRTRGSHELGDEFSKVKDFIIKNHPILLDPFFSPKNTLLFEYTAPDNKIVINYTCQELTHLGIITYDHPSGIPTFLGCPSLIKELSEQTGAKELTFYSLPDDLSKLINLVKSWSDKEGIVIWGQLPDNHMHLAKVKTNEYVKLHNFKYNLTKFNIFQFCWLEEISTEETLKEKIYNLGFDWELASHILPIFQEYLERKAKGILHIKNIECRVEELGIKQLLTMKEKVQKIMENFPEQDFNLAIQYCRGNNNYLNNYVLASILEISVTSAASIKNISLV